MAMMRYLVGRHSDSLISEKRISRDERATDGPRAAASKTANGRRG